MSNQNYGAVANSPVQNTALQQAVSNLQDLERQIRRNTSRIRSLSDQLLGSEATKLGSGGVEAEAPPSANIFQMIERVRTALTEHENAIDRFYNN